MKKLLFTLLCLPLLFNSCQQNNPTPSSSSSSALCGTANLTANGTNYTLNNPLMNPDGTCFKSSMVSVSSVLVNVRNMYSNDWEHEWELNLNISGVFTIGIPVAGGFSGFDASLNLGENTNNPTTSALYLKTYSTTSSSNGSITITNIDNTNNTIDGNFSCTVYHIATTGTTLQPQVISGSFSDIPFI